MLDRFRHRAWQRVVDAQNSPATYQEVAVVLLERVCGDRGETETREFGARRKFRWRRRLKLVGLYEPLATVYRQQTSAERASAHKAERETEVRARRPAKGTSRPLTWNMTIIANITSAQLRREGGGEPASAFARRRVHFVARSQERKRQAGQQQQQQCHHDYTCLCAHAPLSACCFGYLH